jgi:hypothetical protein
MAQVVELVRPAPPRVVRVLTAEELARIRSQLSQAIRSFWASPEGQALAMTLSNYAWEYGELLRQEAKRIGLSTIYKNVAEKAGISAKYKSAWGKA